MRLINGLALMLAFAVSGCDSGDNAPTPPPAPAPAASTAPAVEPTAPSDAPPPVAPVAGNESAAPAAAAPAVEAPGAIDPSQTDPLYKFRMDENGRKLSDQEALQAAASIYTRNASISPSDDTVKPLPGLEADMKQLVQYKMVLSIPPAPGGKKYVFDKGRVNIQ